jgi:DNA modification methylase
MPKPPLRLEVSTLWEYPSQHYTSPSGLTEQGDRDYTGATPSWLIWQLLRRYSHPGDVVVDPMCGSGTTLDVCRDLERRGFGYDLAPAREDIRKADARRLPIDDESVDFVFLDPPYSTHVNYSEDPRCIGKLDAGGDDRGVRYFEAMERVIGECARVLKTDRCMALYVSDSYRKGTGQHARSPRGTLIPLGFELFRLLRRHFAPVDIICVVRHNAKLDRGNYRRAAEEENFFLRGFNYLFVVRKPKRTAPGAAPPAGPPRGEAARRGAPGEAARRGPRGEAARRGPPGEAARRGPAGEAARRGPAGDRRATSGPVPEGREERGPRNARPSSGGIRGGATDPRGGERREQRGSRGGSGPPPRGAQGADDGHEGRGTGSGRQREDAGGSPGSRAPRKGPPRSRSDKGRRNPRRGG